MPVNYIRRSWQTICAIGLLLVSVTASSAQKLSCDATLKDGYDRARGLVTWDEFPRIEIPTDDPQRQFFADTGVPLAVTIWRFLNDIDQDQTLQTTSYFAVRVHSIKDVDDLWGNKLLYVPFSMKTGYSPTEAEQINAAARELLKNLIDHGAATITSYNFDIQQDGKALRIAVISPVVKNIPSSGPSYSDAATAFLEVFTNLRIAESERLKQEVTEEYSAGCLQNFSKQCVVFDIAKTLYRHASEFKNDKKLDIASKICGYVDAK
jgi:hypothetical protein